MEGKKDITVVVAGSGEIKELTIPKGTRAKDILEQAGLSGYDLFRNGQKFEPKDNVYDMVHNGEKLQASVPARVG